MYIIFSHVDTYQYQRFLIQSEQSLQLCKLSLVVRSKRNSFFFFFFLSFLYAFRTIFNVSKRTLFFFFFFFTATVRLNRMNTLKIYLFFLHVMFVCVRVYVCICVCCCFFFLLFLKSNTHTVTHTNIPAEPKTTKIILWGFFFFFLSSLWSLLVRTHSDTQHTQS